MTLLVVGLFLACGSFDGCTKTRRMTGATGPHEAVASALVRGFRPRDAKEVRQACGGAARRSCACARTATRFALNEELHALAFAVLARAPGGCKLRGLRAEALARARRSTEAETLAREALAADPNEPYASYALAHVLYTRGKMVRARNAARLAVQRGRGGVGHLLVGLIDLAGKQYQRAGVSFEAMLKLDGRDIRALYNLALTHHRLNHYRASREGYLKALRVNPRLVDARYNLVLLTHRAGATGEARHHLAKLEKQSPHDPRIPALRQVLRRPVPKSSPRSP